MCVCVCDRERERERERKREEEDAYVNEIEHWFLTGVHEDH